MKAGFNLIVSQYMQHLKYFLAKTCMMINAWGWGKRRNRDVDGEGIWFLLVLAKGRCFCPSFRLSRGKAATMRRRDTSGVCAQGIVFRYLSLKQGIQFQYLASWTGYLKAGEERFAIVTPTFFFSNILIFTMLVWKINKILHAKQNESGSINKDSFLQ